MGKKGRINLSVDKEIFKKAKIKAILEGTSVSRVVEEFLRQWVSTE